MFLSLALIYSSLQSKLALLLTSRGHRLGGLPCSFPGCRRFKPSPLRYSQRYCNMVPCRRRREGKGSRKQSYLHQSISCPMPPHTEIRDTISSSYLARPWGQTVLLNVHWFSSRFKHLTIQSISNIATGSFPIAQENTQHLSVHTKPSQQPHHSFLPSSLENL